MNFCVFEIPEKRIKAVNALCYNRPMTEITNTEAIDEWSNAPQESDD
jgi:hypothetical protein